MTDIATLAPSADGAVSFSDNAPPEAAKPDAFGAHKAHMGDLYVETANWGDGTDIENEAQAAELDRLIRDWKDAVTAAKASEVAETKPLQDQVKAVQQKYWELIGENKTVTGIAVRALTVLLAIKTRWGNKQTALREAEAKRLRDEATEKARAASEAARDAVGDLAATEAAEDLIRDAQKTLRAATQAEKPAVKGLRDNWVVKGFQPVEVDGKWIDGKVTLLRHYFKTNPAALVEACLELAKADVRAGRRSIPGLIIENDRRAV